jgi:uncharacterized membrane protein YraQ (UPF0718 family)/YHS domain-containing protein
MMEAVMGVVGQSLAETFWMFYDTLWALVLGFGLSGAVQAFVSRDEMQRALGDHRPRTVVRSSVLGMISSSCSYAASALAKSLFARGADFTSAMVFMFASTNLVFELGIVLWLLIGWEFAVAEFVGGFVMIVVLTVVLPRVVDVAELDAARARLQTAKASDGHNHAEAETQPWRKRLRSRGGWSDAAGFTISDLTMLRKELVVGFVIAGFASMAVPTSVWRALFLAGHGFWSAVENVVVGPLLAFISFVCSVGNVPLAAALWKGGISFGGVIAFVFADLLALPLVLIYRKFFGPRLALRLSLVFWTVMSLAGLVTEGVFQLAGLIPGELHGDIAVVHVGRNYTTVLNAVAVLAFGYLYWLYRNAERFGGGSGYAKDVVCGMQVRVAHAPARATRDGQTYYFCSDRCLDRFDATAASEALAHEHTAVDPVCGMDVDTRRPGATATIDGVEHYFCMQRCADAFVEEPARYRVGL